MTVITVIEENDPTIVTTPDTAAAAWTAYVPTFRWQTPGGTPATLVVTFARYTQIGKTVHFFCNIGMTNVGIGNSGYLICTLPISMTTGLALFGSGKEAGLTGKMLSVAAIATLTEAYLSFVDNGSPITSGNGSVFLFGGTYEVA